MPAPEKAFNQLTEPLSNEELVEFRRWSWVVTGGWTVHGVDMKRLVATIDARDQTIKEMVVQLGRIAGNHPPVEHEERGGVWFCPICSRQSKYPVINTNCAPTIAQKMLEHMVKTGAMDGINVPAAERARKSLILNKDKSPSETQEMRQK